MKGPRFKDTIWYKISLYGLEIIGKYYGSYRAFVHDNADPLDMNRLQLIIPTLNEKIVDPTWAFPKNCWGGKNYGINMLPRKADVVWVEFQNGDANFPIWTHAGYAKNEKPKEFSTPNHYGFKTPRGSLVLINDVKDEEEILVKLNNGKEWVKINKEQLEIEAKLIKLGANGDEKAVMGETLLSKLENLSDKLDDTYNAIIKHKHTSSNKPPSPVDLIVFKKIQTEVKGIKDKLPDFLSGKVKIDK